MNGRERRWASKHQQNDLMQVLRRSVEPAPRQQTFGIAPPPLPVALPARRNAHLWLGVVRSQTHKAQKFQSGNVGLGLAIAKQFLNYITKAFG